MIDKYAPFGQATWKIYQDKQLVILHQNMPNSIEEQSSSVKQM